MAMIAGLPERQNADLTAWAAEQLGVGPQTPPEEVRAAFLRSLPQRDFVPPASVRQALRILAPVKPSGLPSLPSDDSDFLAREGELRAEIERFAVEFFNLGLGRRQQRWQELYDRCSWSQTLGARLRALVPGLKVDRNCLASAGPYRRRLAHYVCDLFLLRPAERAAQRRALLEGMADDMGEWEWAAKQMLRENAALAGLEPGFVRQVASRQSQQRALEQRRHRPSPRKKATSGSGENRWIAWLAIIVVVGIVKIIAGTSSSKNSPRPPEIHQPDVNLNNPDIRIPQDNAIFNDELRRQIEKQRGRPFTDEEWEEWRRFGAPQKPIRIEDPLDKPDEPD
jgi:hypothetical protein